MSRKQERKIHPVQWVLLLIPAGGFLWFSQSLLAGVMGVGTLIGWAACLAGAALILAVPRHGAKRGSPASHCLGFYRDFRWGSGLVRVSFHFDFLCGGKHPAEFRHGYCVGMFGVPQRGTQPVFGEPHSKGGGVSSGPSRGSVYCQRRPGESGAGFRGLRHGSGAGRTGH